MYPWPLPGSPQSYCVCGQPLYLWQLSSQLPPCPAQLTFPIFLAKHLTSTRVHPLHSLGCDFAPFHVRYVHAQSFVTSQGGLVGGTQFCVASQILPACSSAPLPSFPGLQPTWVLLPDLLPAGNQTSHGCGLSTSLHYISESHFCRSWAFSSSSSSWPRDQTQVFWVGRWIFYQLSHKGSPYLPGMWGG